MTLTQFTLAAHSFLATNAPQKHHTEGWEGEKWPPNTFNPGLITPVKSAAAGDEDIHNPC